MEPNEEVSNIMLSSNIMTREKYNKDRWFYIPADLLPEYYSDVRAARFLSQDQRLQLERKLFMASGIIDED